MITTPTHAAEGVQRPIGVVIRLNPDDHEVVTEYARSKKMSVQELIEARDRMLNELSKVGRRRARIVRLFHAGKGW